MGQKVNPIGFRLGINKTWDSKWYVKKADYAKTLLEDIQIRKELMNMTEVESSDVSKIEIKRNPQRLSVFFYTAKPGVLIGKSGASIEKIQKKIEFLSHGKKVNVKVIEISKPTLDANLVANSIARQIEARGGYKRILKKAVSDAMKDGAQGIKIKVAGRLNGVEIARSDSIKEGRVPLHTLRSKIDYAVCTANTSYGSIGVKVWIYSGESSSAQEVKSDAGEVVRKRKEGVSDNA